MVMLHMWSLIGCPSTLNSSSRKGPMLATVEASKSARQSWSLTSRKPDDSARPADGPVSARMHNAGALPRLSDPCSASIGAAERKQADPVGSANPMCHFSGDFTSIRTDGYWVRYIFNICFFASKFKNHFQSDRILIINGILLSVGQWMQRASFR